MFFTDRNRKLESNIKKLVELEKRIISLIEENNTLLEVIENRERILEKIISEKSNGFPWLANAISEFHHYQDIEIARFLERKKNPAFKKAENIREIALENKILRKQSRVAQGIVNYYENLFPWITEYLGESLEDLLTDISESIKAEDQDEVDPVLKFIPKSEYDSLPIGERNQKALDRYLSSRKKPYEIGRDYERFIGYMYEKDGYQVEYVGIEKGFEDLGRDLVCKKGNDIEIVQCKCWSNYKTIHEKHINQLYGTVVKFFIDQNETKNEIDGPKFFPDLMSSGKIKATFVTSTKLSETAKKFAIALGVKVVEEKPLEQYPLIKCNIGKNGEKIYHLPFDQQYDKTQIKNIGEFYASTVFEAEEQGFRRAYKWRG